MLVSRANRGAARQARGHECSGRSRVSSHSRWPATRQPSLAVASARELLAELVEVRAAAEDDDAVAGGEGLVAAGGNSTRPSARFTAMTITPVRRPMSASRRVWPRSGLPARIGTSSISIARLRALGDQLGELDGRGVGQERDDPVGADRGGQDTWLAPACWSFFSVLGCSARATIITLGHIWRAVRVMKTSGGVGGHRP